MIQGPHLIIAYEGPPNKSENQNIVNESYSTLVGNIFLNVALPWIRNLWMSFHCFHPSPTIGMMSMLIDLCIEESKFFKVQTWTLSCHIILIQKKLQV